MNSYLTSYLRSVALSLDSQSCSPLDIRAALPSFSLVNFTKLTVAAFCWSYGFMIYDGKECWGKDTDFQNTPAKSSCTLDSVFLSGFFASIGLCGAIIIMDGVLDWSKTVHHTNTSYSTLSVLLLSVFISDASWSYWNYLSFAIASSGDDSYTFGGYFAASIIGFLLNAAFFYAVHNGITYSVEQIVVNRGHDEKIVEGGQQFWYCDILFAGIVWGAYYGFGPFGMGIALQIDANSELGIACCNALGTLLGSLLFFAVLYGPIIVHNECYPLSDEMEKTRKHQEDKRENKLDKQNKEEEVEMIVENPLSKV